MLQNIGDNHVQVPTTKKEMAITKTSIVILTISAETNVLERGASHKYFERPHQNFSWDREREHMIFELSSATNLFWRALVSFFGYVDFFDGSHFLSRAFLEEQWILINTG